ncbi:MAG: hypothetical protein PGN13_09880 [Patulibacter minatonensis]
MLATVFLLVTSLAGFAVATRVVPWAPAIVRYPAGFFLALVFSSAGIYAIANGFATDSAQSLRIGLIVATLVGGLVLWIWGRRLTRDDFRMPTIDKVVTLIAFVFSWWIVNERLREQGGTPSVSGNAWSDFALHVGLSRSFSVGGNYGPTEYPFFSGEPIHYHFGFDFFAGALQKGGFSILGSFNLPGAIGFTSMLVITFALARLLFSPAEPVRWFRDRGVWSGAVAMVLLVTNQSLEWLRYIEKDGKGNLLTALDPDVLWKHNGYAATGPYSDDPIAIFNSLNPYLGQTHLITQVALVLLLAYLMIALVVRDGEGISKRVLFGLGVFYGVAFWQNGVVWIAGAVFFAGLIGVWAVTACWQRFRESAGQPKKDRRRAVRKQGFTWVWIGVAFALPALLLGAPAAIHLAGGGEGSGLNVHLGYLACNPTAASCHGGQLNPLSPADWWTWIGYWWVNEGAFFPLLILAFIVGSVRDRKIIAAIFVIFLWGNVFSVGLDLGGFNHKLFNLWEALSGPFAAYGFVVIWLAAGRLWRRRRALGLAARTATVAVGLMLIVSGVIDFMTIKNDFLVGIFGDEVQMQTTDWIIRQTPRDATFLTDYDQMYQPPSMAGRRVALGYSPWAATSGYDVEPRKQLVGSIYSATDRGTACTLLKQNRIDYVLVGPLELRSERFQINTGLFLGMTPEIAFGADQNQYTIYKTAANCA